MTRQAGTASSALSGRGARWLAGLLLAALCALPAAAPAQQVIAGRVGAAGTARPQGADPADTVLKTVRLEQKLNAALPLDTPFVNEDGQSVRLADYFGAKPVMLMLIQYRCTMLCSEELNVLLESLKEMQFTPGKEFTLLIVSIDPREKPDLASEMKKNILETYGRPQAASGWHFLMGSKENIDRLAGAVGYHYVYDGRTDQYAHPDGVIIATPAGKVARYFFRLEYPAKDMRLGLVEAADGKIGTALDAIALLCFHYNPTTGKYALAVLSVVRLLSIATVVALALGIVVMRRWDRRKSRQAGDAALQA